jgi:leucyl aminopeptidase
MFKLLFVVSLLITKFESANQLKIGLGKQTLNGKMVQKLAMTLANTANQFNLKALFLPVLISEIEADDFVYIVTQTIANNDYQVQKIEIEATLKSDSIMD